MIKSSRITIYGNGIFYIDDLRSDQRHNLSIGNASENGFMFDNLAYDRTLVCVFTLPCLASHCGSNDVPYDIDLALG